jgi:hypothetical protein
MGLDRWAVRMDQNDSGYWMAVGVTTHTVAEADALGAGNWAAFASDDKSALFCTMTLRWCYDGKVYNWPGTKAEDSSGVDDPSLVRVVPAPVPPKVLTPMVKTQAAMTTPAEGYGGRRFNF